MKKITVVVLTLACLKFLIGTALADITGPATLHFDTSKISPDVASMQIAYEYRIGHSSAKSRMNPITQSTLDLSMLPQDAKTRLAVLGTIKQGNGDPIMDFLDDSFLPPKHPLCDLSQISSGSHTVTFTLEDAYSSWGQHEKSGSYLLCAIS
jgi:hypothetical protein